jgi:hypothetical protein
MEYILFGRNSLIAGVKNILNSLFYNKYTIL